jgi:uncharacterized membrane protein YgcG
MNRIALAACALVASCTTNAPAIAAPTFPDRGRAAVVDAAGIIPADRERALNERIVSWVASTGNQLVVTTVPSLYGQEITDYGYRLGRHWGLGKDASATGSTGVILLLAPKERKVRIEVGYGLEGSLTDAVTSDILRRDIVPSLKAGDQVGALETGASAIMEAAVSANPPVREDRHRHNWIVPSGAAAIVMLFGSLGLWLWLGARRVDRRMRAMAAEHEAARHRAEAALHRKPARTFAVSTPAARPSPVSRPRSAPISSASPPPAPPPPSTRRDNDDYRPSSYSPPASDWSEPSSGWSSSDSGSSSSSGFDSGGGSFGGGGSDSSY